MKRGLMALASITLMQWSGAALAEKWVLTTLEWPPFACEKCPEQGAGVKALRDAMKTVGVEVEVVFMPWARAVAEAEKPAYVGYYPAWPEDVVAGFVPSPVIFRSPVGFIEPTGKPLAWESLADLKGKRFGVVQGYGNTKEFNEAAAAGVFRTDVVPTDQQNVQKVAAGRLDGAFIDLNNARWFLSGELKDLAPQVTINAKSLADKDLLVALGKANADKAAKIEEALKNVDTAKIVSDYLAANLK